VTGETWTVAQADTHAPAASHGAEAAHGAAHGGGSGIDPMHQFEIKRFIPLEIFGLDISFTNSALSFPDLCHARAFAGARTAAIDG
jgi:F-type H+-transporting ATPase subunit a